MGLLSALGRGAKSFGKHYVNTAGAGTAYGALAGGGLNAYGDMQNGGDFNATHAIEGALGGAMLGAIPGSMLGLARGAGGAIRAARMDPALIHRARRALLRAGVSEGRLRQLADDDIVKAAFGL